MEKILTKKVKLRLRKYCPYMINVGGIGYICNKRDGSEEYQRECIHLVTVQSRTCLCFGCTKVVQFVSPTILNKLLK